MGRPKSLEQRAAIVADRIRGRDLSALPKGVLTEIGRLERALGLDRDFLSYSARSQRRFLQGAKLGRTAAEQRKVEREQAAVRKAAKAAQRGGAVPGIKSQAQWTRIVSLRDELRIEGMNVIKGEDTQTDHLDFDDLYTDESLEEHVKVYGFSYVIDRLEHQLSAIQQYNQSGGRNRSIGRDEMRRKFGAINRKDFAASAASFYNEDERWSWYHASNYATPYNPGTAKLIGM